MILEAFFIRIAFPADSADDGLFVFLVVMRPQGIAVEECPIAYLANHGFMCTGHVSAICFPEKRYFSKRYSI